MERRSVPIKQSLDRVFIDASFLIALINRRDQYHEVAREFDNTPQTASEIWTTDAALLELSAALSAPPLRGSVTGVWDKFHGGDDRFRSMEASAQNLTDAMNVFRSRPDKGWSLADCFSFLVMPREGLVDALTTDQHFVQAGYRALLLE